MQNRGPPLLRPRDPQRQSQGDQVARFKASQPLVKRLPPQAKPITRNAVVTLRAPGARIAPERKS